MHRPTSRHARVCTGVFAVAALVALSALAPAALASSSSAADQSASPAPAAAPATTITSDLSPATVVYGDGVTVKGQVTPAAAGEQVNVSLGGAVVATVQTDATGAYSAHFEPARSGDVTATVVADGTRSAAQHLVVKPKVTVTHGSPVPFCALGFTVKVEPASYGGTLMAEVAHRGANVATVKAAVRSGKASFQVPLRGIDKFDVTVSLPAADGLGARAVQTTVQAKWARVATGSSGSRVRGLLTALSRLHFRVPYIGTSFNSQCADSVVAFQKAYGLTRDYVFGADDWRKLDGAKLIKPRHSGPSTHLEVDNGRQILMVVKNGAAYGIIAVSTGATNNTPEGSFHIQQKHPYTTSGFGGILFRTMGFVGNFAIHGYSPVPPYPASHGCVREPMWVADWTYNQSWVGEQLYVYH